MASFFRAAFWTIAIVLLCAWAIQSCAPTDYYKPVPPATIQPGSVSGAPCPWDSRVVSAVATNSTGPYTLYNVTCSDGTTTLWAQ